MKLPPVVAASLSAVAIDCCSNIIAQRLRAWNNEVPFVFDRVLFFQMAFLVAVTAPVNYHWQNWLERAFPGWKTVKKTREAVGDDEEKGAFLKDDGEDKKMIEEEVRVRNWFNIFRKWFTDCITMGALLNTTMFLVIMGLLKGKTGSMIMTDIKNEELKIIWDSYKVWPIANFFSTTYCPVERRIVFLSFCGLLWNIYLTLVAARL
ncbi:integral membrane protein-like protein [Corynespora cassiicola Philippines]|uniref:Integral membrane protein-like protein n=1 Tax=Corynespora cassiicola Philippines TaxID=1448308 RepID=A0A2T2P954_CORCC|nr:integral membrane protein-like protein [Corynespora cassiicola Philippines]